MKQSKFNTDASHLTNWQMRPSGRRLEITILSFPVSLPALVSEQNRYETLYGTQTKRDDLLFPSMVDTLFSFSLWSEAGGYFSLDNLSTLCRWPNWYCLNKCHFFLHFSTFFLSICVATIDTKLKFLRGALGKVAALLHLSQKSRKSLILDPFLFDLNNCLIKWWNRQNFSHSL